MNIEDLKSESRMDQIKQNDFSSIDAESGDSLYIKTLEYDKKYEKGFINAFIGKFRIVLLFMIAIMVWGVYSFYVLPLESTPEVKIPFAIVNVSLPGASPADVEELVIKKVEDEIINIKGIKNVNAVAYDSFATISVEFQAEEEISEAIRRLRDAVDNVKGSLPSEASDPVVNEVSFSNSPVWTFVLSGPYDGFVLQELAEKAEKELKKLAGVGSVIISGGDTREIAIRLDPAKMAKHNLSVDQVTASLRSNNFTLPLGTIELGSYEYSLRAENELTNIVLIRELPIIFSNGDTVKLKDIASVFERASAKNTISRFSLVGSAPDNAITISVIKKTGFSIIELIDKGKTIVNDLVENSFPAGMKIETTMDESDFIRQDFQNLQRDATTTITLVIIILFLFVGFKEAIVAGITIPLVFAATFGLMSLFGVTINFLSLFSLILALGLLVDDAIVIVQAMKQYLRCGRFTPEQAARLVFRDFKTLIVTTSCTTIFAFLPLLLATGIIGQFIRSIPITVSLILFSSTVIAIFINLPLAAYFERYRLLPKHFSWIFATLIVTFFVLFFAVITTPELGALMIFSSLAFLIFILSALHGRYIKEKLRRNYLSFVAETANDEAMIERINKKYICPETQKTLWAKLSSGLIKMDLILPYYQKIIISLMDSIFKRILFFIFVIIIFVSSVYLPASGILKSEFLSPSDYALMFVNIEGPPGRIIEETEIIASKVEQILLKEKNIKNFTTVIGNAGINVNDGFSARGSGGQSHLAQITINLYPEKERPFKEKSYDFASRLRKKIMEVEGAEITVQEVSGGPPVGADIEMRLLGEDLNELELLGEKYKNMLAQIPGVINAKTSVSLSPGEFTFRINKEKTQQYGVSPVQVSSALRTAISGSEVIKIVTAGIETKLIMDFEDEFVNDLSLIQKTTVQTIGGQKMPLSQLVDVVAGSSLTSIVRINQKRVISVTANTQKPVLPSEVLADFQKKIASDPPATDIAIEFGGENESNSESILSILKAMIVAFILIVCTLVLQFNSFRRAVLVLATIPLAVTGVFWGLSVFGYTLSFPALIGVLALFGIVVKNAIILVDKIRLNQLVGIPFREAIVDAAKSRLEAIFLTTASTMIGMLPITLNNEAWGGLGATLVFGLSTSTILTLIVIPILYYSLFFDESKEISDIKNYRQKNSIS